jgi:hypothetical protein
MADEFELGELGAAFAALRREVAPLVRPAGMATARATARHRRRMRVVMLSILAVIVIIVPVVAYANIDRAHRLPPPVLESPIPSPVESESPAPVGSPSTGSPSIAPGGPGGVPPSIGFQPFIVVSGSDLGFKIPRVSAIAVPFGVRVSGTGRASAVRLTLNTAGIQSKVDVIGVTGPCTIFAAQITCDFGDLAQGRYTERMTLQAKPGVPFGSAGRIEADTTDTSPFAQTHVSDQIWIDPGAVAELDVRSSIPSGRVVPSCAAR